VQQGQPNEWPFGMVCRQAKTGAQPPKSNIHHDAPCDITGGVWDEGARRGGKGRVTKTNGSYPKSVQHGDNVGFPETVAS
jgi:hypothetical protein